MPFAYILHSSQRMIGLNEFKSVAPNRITKLTTVSIYKVTGERYTLPTHFELLSNLRLCGIINKNSINPIIAKLL
ncbi:hypothetical protein EB796_013993 [Bugula neritina]|uniref:Uncharacterized protein n=1 Tax=Bugula neritina TaxID=10212 RepID=A0A7J7JPU5_BUGNE|nr:hypothetical protein EB796_013993 [Bugula neritina]